MAPELGRRDRHGPGRARVVEPKSFPFREQELVPIARGRKAHRQGIETVRCSSGVEPKCSFALLLAQTEIRYGKVDNKGMGRQTNAIELSKHLPGGTLFLGEG